MEQGLAGLAAIAARRAQGQPAARLLGAATATGPIGDAEVVAQLEQHFFTPARGQHGEQLWKHAHAEGARLAFEEAIALAVSPGATPAQA